MDFEVYVLGTGGMQPLPRRFLNSALVRRKGELFLFDAGEGTQVALKKLSLHWKKINKIFISHIHADHVTGLPGLLLLSSQVDRDEPLHIYGPSPLEEYIEASRRILDMYINYEIVIHTITQNETIVDSDEYCIKAFELDHRKQCFGYTLIEKERNGEFNKDKAIELGVPMGPLWGKLQRGEDVCVDGKVIKSSDIVGEKRKGRKFSFITDTTYTEDAASHVFGSDLLLIEGMFEHALVKDAHEKKHLTVVESATIAKDAEAKKAGFMHHSPRYSESELKRLEKEGKEVYPNVFMCKDGMHFDIPLKP